MPVLPFSPNCHWSFTSYLLFFLRHYHFERIFSQVFLHWSFRFSSWTLFSCVSYLFQFYLFCIPLEILYLLVITYKFIYSKIFFIQSILTRYNKIFVEYKLWLLHWVRDFLKVLVRPWISFLFENPIYIFLWSNKHFK